ncbi:DUF6876 family protein [Flavisolibacter ginsengisoli]|jgi:hypothetical protein|uniref:DUF6876 domain-containing protein n=1 Tax=Flavisolibacter ginsengisoli DSM 18119 TaxID=1121884 RepID=A0A1M5CFL3_9BACT|nr:DUF6876 family protein [Flavisolibacter ginsengisoli]SHF53554.1 hypothetical protein SAMN02745131_02922 [Flavisolibacter ginsengisoli DSM 18119]
MNASETLEITTAKNWHKHPFGMLYIDDIESLCENLECYWLRDLVMVYQQQLKGEEFQVWLLKKYDDCSAIVTCEDGNGNILRHQEISFTDFEATEATTWLECAWPCYQASTKSKANMLENPY